MKSLLLLLGVACSSPPPPKLADLFAATGVTYLGQSPGALYGANMNGSVWRFDKTTHTQQPLAAMPVTISDFAVIDDDDVYFAAGLPEDRTVTLYRVQGAMPTVVAEEILPGSLRADDDALYWIQTSASASSVQRLAKAATTPQMLANNVETTVPEIAVDDTNVYWFNSAGGGAILRADKRAGGASLFRANIELVELGVDDLYLYYLPQSAGVPDPQLTQVLKSTGVARTLNITPTRYWPSGQTIFYTQYDSLDHDMQLLNAVARDGTRQQTLVENLRTFSLIQLVRDGPTLYWSDDENVVQLAPISEP